MPRRRCARSWQRGALPVVLGGDHAVNIPCIRAFSGHGPIHVVQIDAHLDFVDVRHGVREGHGNPMRRAAEQDYVTGLSQIGIRNVSSTAREGYDDARARGSTILSVRQARRLGTEGVLATIPEGARYYVTIDIDGFDPSIAPGTGTPSHGGFLYYEVMELLQGLVKRGSVVGIDLVEVAPAYDPSGMTGFLAAQVLLNFLGYIFAEPCHGSHHVGPRNQTISARKGVAAALPRARASRSSIRTAARSSTPGPSMPRTLPNSCQWSTAAAPCSAFAPPLATRC